MGGRLMRSESFFSFHLEGDNAVDAKILAKALRNIAELAQITAYSQDDESFIKLNVTTFREGCFEIVFQTVSEAVKWAILNPLAASDFSSTVVNTIVGMFQLKKFLKGEKPASCVPAGNNSINVTNLHGNIISVPEGSTIILNSYKVDNSVSDISALIQKNNPCGGFTIETENSKISYDPSDIDYMSKPFPFFEESTENVKITTTEVTLPIATSVFKGKSQWSLMLKDKIISARIEDSEWLHLVQSGKIAISSNMALRAILRAEIKLTEDYAPIHSTLRYTIVKVIDLIDLSADSIGTQMEIE